MPGAHTKRIPADRERPSSSEIPMESQSVDHVLEEHMMVMKSLWTSKEGFDLTLVCETAEFKVHSFLLKPRSKFFAAACEGRFLEATTKRIELPDDSVGSVGRLVQYCYTMNYPDEKAERTTNSGELMDPSYISRAHTNAQVYALAEKYDVPGLKALARTKFCAAAVAEFNPRVSRNSPPDMTHLILVISLVYNSTPGTDRSLREVIITYMWTHWKQLSPEPDFHALIAANPEMIIQAVSNRFGQQLP